MTQDLDDWLQKLKDLNGGELYVQHDEVRDCEMVDGRCSQSGKRGHIHHWHLWPCKHGLPVFHNSVLSLQVLFEYDPPQAVAGTPEDWTYQRTQFERFFRFLRENSIPHEFAYGGSKSHHLSVYVDPENLDFTEETADIVDLPYIIRKTVLKALPRLAGVELPFDESNNNAHDDKKGRMVRAYGTQRPGKLPKTWMAVIPKTRPTEYEWTLPPNGPETWRAANLLKDEIEAAIRRAVEEKNAEVAVTEEHLSKIGKDWKRLMSNGWFVKGVIWPAGKREMRGTMSIRAMLTAGLTQGEARAELTKLRVHVAEKDYDFKTHWFEKISRLYKEKRVLTNAASGVAAENPARKAARGRAEMWKKRTATAPRRDDGRMTAEEQAAFLKEVGL